MSECAVELRDVTKTFSSGRGGLVDQVQAVKEINLEIRPGEFFTLLGPSGCGKTTTLRLIAGFESPTTGEIFIRGQSMNGVPPNLRPVNTVFQNYALFPHMNVSKNVGFGLAVKRVPKDRREKLVQEALDLVQLADMGNRRPSQLSGGQQQRIALARALVNQPAVLLLDEPLGALDLKLRKAMQLELKQLQVQIGITFVYVTHDQEEALTMSDRIAVMNAGVILQMGDPVTLYEKPATRFVADFIGESNFLKGQVEHILDGQAQLLSGGKHLLVSVGAAHPTPGEQVVFTVRPEKMRLAEHAQDAPSNLEGEIREVVYIGTDTRYLVSLFSGETIVVRIQNGCGRELGQFHKGERVNVNWEPEEACLLQN